MDGHVIPNTSMLLGFVPQGGFQILLDVKDMDQNLIARFQIDQSGSPRQANETESVPSIEYSAVNGSATLRMSVTVSCANGFSGPRCDCMSRNDSTGHFECGANGEKICLAGYQDPASNCTACIAADGCCECMSTA